MFRQFIRQNDWHVYVQRQFWRREHILTPGISFPEGIFHDDELFSVQAILTALFASIPYSSDKTPFEHYFQAVIYLVFTLLGKLVQCEVRSGKGRADCVIETINYVYLFEFKLDKSADEALAQIEENGYALPYATDTRKLLKIGVNFDSQQRNITEWKVKE